MKRQIDNAAEVEGTPLTKDKVHSAVTFTLILTVRPAAFAAAGSDLVSDWFLFGL